jgi:hypothetical protein
LGGDPRVSEVNGMDGDSTESMCVRGRRRTWALIAAGALAAMIAGPSAVHAAKGGATPAQPWIELATVDGASVAASLAPNLGGWVTFATGYPKNLKNPRIEVLCYQGGSLVYGEAGSTVDSFLLGGGGSAWKTGGGEADCTANLFYFGSRSGTQTYEWLAATSFHAEG